MGVGIVGIEELLINPSQRQIISLQSRPHENDNVTGTLTVEVIGIRSPLVWDVKWVHIWIFLYS